MVLVFNARLLHVPLIVVPLLAGCGGGGGGGGGSAPGGPRPQGAPAVAPSSVKITALASPATVSVSEPGYGGAFTPSAASCAGIATVAAGSAAGSYTITGVTSGVCTISFADTFGQSAALPVSVTTSVVTAQ